MISTLEKEITFRFLKARKKDGFLNVISIFSFIGISLGVAVLIIVMSVMNGFRTELINKIVGFNPHITVKSYDNNGIDREKLNNNNLNFITKSLIFSNSGEAIILKNNTSKGIVLRGYQAKDFSNLTIIKNDKFKGNKSKLNKNSISIGNELSFSLDLKIGDKITLMSPSGIETIIGSMPKQKTFEVTSIFNSGLADFDNNIALINLDTLDDFSKLELINNKNFVGETKKLEKNFISIGKELSFSFDLEIGDNISIMSSSGVETIIGNLPKQKTFTVISIFDSGLADFDNNIIFLNLETLEEFSNLSKNDRNLEVYLKNPQKIENQKDIVQKIFPMDLVSSWADMNKSLFSALKVERNVMFIILSLIIIVAAFNIISGLTILVKNKTKDIAILKSIGVLNNSIIKIFFLIGVIIGTSATLFGIFLGVTFSIYVESIREFISNTFDITLFPEEIYFLSTLPSEINLSSIFLISICSIFITILVSIFPAMKAAKLDPIKSLKYE